MCPWQNSRINIPNAQKNLYILYTNMSSVLRSIGVTKDTPLKFNGFSGPFYYDSELGYMPFPFTYANGVLDIALIDNFEANMIDDTGNIPQIGDNVDTRLLRLMGGSGLVKSLGPNFIRYIKAWRSSTIDAGSSVGIQVPAVMTKIQSTSVDELSTDECFGISSVPPSSDNYVTGNETNNFRTTWIFKTPLTITTVESGETKYITLSSFLGPDYG